MVQEEETLGRERGRKNLIVVSILFPVSLLSLRIHSVGGPQHCMGRAEILLQAAQVTCGAEGTSNGAGTHVHERTSEIDASFAVHEGT